MGKKGKNKAKGAVAAGEEQGRDRTGPAASASEAPSASGGKRTKDEIDDIFAVVKKAKPDEVCVYT